MMKVTYIRTLFAISTTLLAVCCFAGDDGPRDNGLASQSVEPLVIWTGAYSGINKPEYARVVSGKEWRALWNRHASVGATDYDELHNVPCIPQVNFERCTVVAIFRGPMNCTCGIKVHSITEEARHIRLRFSVQFYNNIKRDPTMPYGIVALPRSEKEVVLEEQGPNDREGNPTWRQIHTFKSLEK